MTVLELFCGIGTVSYVLKKRQQLFSGAKVTAGIDLNENAQIMFEANFDSAFLKKDIGTLTSQTLRQFNADLWWMSPPCQPFTRRGLRRDQKDNRTQALLHLIEVINEVLPRVVVLENVVGFEGSSTFQTLTSRLVSSGYYVTYRKLCSSCFGLPNLRPRVFLVASIGNPVEIKLPVPATRERLAGFLDDELTEQCDYAVDSSFVTSYWNAIHVCAPSDDLSRCFTSAYGRSHVRSGSYLEVAGGFRRFTPREVARILGFGDDFSLPARLNKHQQWKLLGNAISVPCVEHILQSVFSSVVYSSRP